jgi:hypothetical protein
MANLNRPSNNNRNSPWLFLLFCTALCIPLFSKLPGVMYCVTLLPNVSLVFFAQNSRSPVCLCVAEIFSPSGAYVLVLYHRPMSCGSENTIFHYWFNNLFTAIMLEYLMFIVTNLFRRSRRCYILKASTVRYVSKTLHTMCVCKRTNIK